MRIIPHFSREFCGSSVAQASACVVLICVGAEKSTQTEICATRGALAPRLNPKQKVAIPRPTPWGECEKCGLEIRLAEILHGGLHEIRVGVAENRVYGVFGRGLRGNP